MPPQRKSRARSAAPPAASAAPGIAGLAGAAGFGAAGTYLTPLAACAFTAAWMTGAMSVGLFAASVQCVGAGVGATIGVAGRFVAKPQW